MVATGHVAAGFALGIILVDKIDTPQTLSFLIFIFMLGILSHFITDFIPHGHFATGKKNPYAGHEFLIDMFLSFVFFPAYTFFSFGLTFSSLCVLSASIGAIMPDVWVGIAVKIPKFKKSKIFKLEQKLHGGVLHWHGTGPKALPIRYQDAWQVAVILLALVLPLWF